MPRTRDEACATLQRLAGTLEHLGIAVVEHLDRTPPAIEVGDRRPRVCVTPGPAGFFFVLERCVDEERVPLVLVRELRRRAEHQLHRLEDHAQSLRRLEHALVPTTLNPGDTMQSNPDRTPVVYWFEDPVDAAVAWFSHPEVALAFVKGANLAADAYGGGAWDAAAMLANVPLATDDEVLALYRSTRDGAL